MVRFTRRSASKRGMKRTRRSTNLRALRTYRPVRSLVPRNSANRGHAFKRMLGSATITGNVAYSPYLNAYSGQQINLAAVQGTSDFQNLYDQYRINYIVIKFWLRIDPSAQTAASASFPKLYWYRDYDDESTPASLNEIRENGRCKIAVMNPNRPVTIKFRPNSLNTVYAGVATSTYKPVWRQWLDVAVPSARHYGIKYGIDDLTNTNYKVDIEAMLYLECRNSR